MDHSLDALVYGDAENDADLEAELLDLLADQQTSSVPRPRAIPAGRPRPVDPVPRGATKGYHNQVADVDNLHKFATDMKSLEVDENDDEPIDENDPDLLAELADVLDGGDSEFAIDTSQPIAPIPASGRRDSVSGLITDRLQNYMDALKDAQSKNDASRVRRLTRGVKTLQGQLKQASQGRPVNPEDILPPVATGKHPPEGFNHGLAQLPPEQPAPPIPPRPSHAASEAPRSSHQPPVELPPISHHRNIIRVSGPESDAMDSSGVRSFVLEDDEAKQPKPTAFVLPQIQIDSDLLHTLTHRRDAYKHAALEAKHAQDRAAAVRCIKMAKHLDSAIDNLNKGLPVDMASLPANPPSKLSASPSSKFIGGDTEDKPPVEPEEEGKSAAELLHVPPPPSTVMEALTQRHDKYKSAATEAKAEGNSSKSRRMARLQKQYSDAIKNYKAGKPVDFDELPVPPGFGPIPTGGGGAGKPGGIHKSASGGNLKLTDSGDVKSRHSVPGNLAGYSSDTDVSPSASVKLRPSSPSGRPACAVRSKSPGRSPGTSSTAGQKVASRQEKQLAFLIERQRQFKEAALFCKKKGNIDDAKLYLRHSKAIENMIEGSKNGLPANLGEIPVPPQLQVSDQFLDPLTESYSLKRGSVLIEGSREETYATLEKDLIRQYQVCRRNAEYFTKIADVSKATLFDKLSMHSKRDLVSLRNGLKHGDPLPRFHYENRTLPSVQVCTDLSDKDFEVRVARAVMVPCPSGWEPKDMALYVKFVLPYPADSPQEAKTDVVKATNSPSWKFCSKFTIDRKSRALARVFRAKVIRFDVILKGHLFRSDKVLAHADVKLTTLESVAEIHESLDLMDGRKPSGGKLEIHIRVREPLGAATKAADIEEKWLIIDEFLKRPASVAPQRLSRVDISNQPSHRRTEF